MTAYAFLETPLPCPQCAALITDEVWFQWGFCRSRAKAPQSTYRVQDSIHWQSSAAGSTPAWTQFIRAGRSAGINCGDPRILDLIVRDVAQHWLREACPKCGALLDGAALEIRAGKIVRGWLSRRGELPDDEYLLIASDGSLSASNWGDHALVIDEETS